MGHIESLPQSEPDKQYEYDAIFVLPAYPFPQEKVRSLEGLVEQFAGLPKRKHPSGLLFDTRLRNIAAALLVRNGETARIVTMSRPVRSWMKESCASLMENHIKTLISSHGNVEIIREEESYDLLTEIEQIAGMSEEMNLGKVGIITDSIQKHRIKQIIVKSDDKFPKHEIKAWEEILTDESCAGQRKEGLEAIQQKVYKSAYWRFWKTRETMSRVATHLSPHLVRTVSSITRK